MTRFLLFATLLFTTASTALANTLSKTAIIKADDLRSTTANWDRFVAISAEKKIPISIGIIAASLQEKNPDYFAWIKEHQASGVVEFWNHGLIHKRWDGADSQQICEFSGSGYEFQKENFETAQNLMQKVLGHTPVAFGAPYNAIDEDTVRILNENPKSRLFFCNRPHDKLSNIPAPMNLRGEHNGTGKPNFEKFKEEYIKKTEVTFTALQFHPNNFQEEHFSEYSRIIDYMIADGWTFLLPADYLLIVEP